MKGKLIKKKDNWYNLYQGEIGIGSTYEELQGYKLSLENCQAIELGYDLEVLKKEYINNQLNGLSSEDYEQWFSFAEHDSTIFIEGFQTALDLIVVKEFDYKDMVKAIIMASSTPSPIDGKMWKKRTPAEIINSLRKNIWDVEVEIEYITKDSVQIPKLDENGYIILKRC